MIAFITQGTYRNRSRSSYFNFKQKVLPGSLISWGTLVFHWPSKTAKISKVSIKEGCQNQKFLEHRIQNIANKWEAMSYCKLLLLFYQAFFGMRDLPLSLTGYRESWFSNCGKRGEVRPWYRECLNFSIR